MRPGHLNGYEVRIEDEKGDTIDSLAVDAVNLRVALERTVRLISTRDSGHGQKAAALTIRRSAISTFNAPKGSPSEDEGMDTL